ncbi:MAG: hypothetical protein K0S07_1442 [Chlamydiales bacterium]|jgi:hypothetical protein|nr:hypothetical protein [Chlamydiales bacterium]
MLKYLLFSLLLCTQGISAAAIQAISVGDYGSSINSSTEKDLLQIENTLQEISCYTGMNLHHIELPTLQLDRDAVLDAIDALQVEEDDVLFFYYSGHGMRSKSKDSAWPDLFFGWHQLRLDLDLVIERCLQKGARLTLIITDCCNNVVETPYYFFKSLGGKLSSEEQMANYRALFLEHQGILVISSSQPGELSWCNSDGGFFTFCFLQSLELELQHKNPSWQSLIERTSLLLPIYLPQKKQTPLFEINLQHTDTMF